MAAWERYESKRNDLADKLTGAEKELEDIKKVRQYTSRIVTVNQGGIPVGFI